MTVREYIGARYVPLFMGEWSDQNTYEPLSIVVNQGNSYTSRQSVPVGIAITNNAYWALTGNYNAQVEEYRNEVLRYGQEVQLLDGRISGIEDTLPNTKFNSENTVSDAIDNVEDSIDGYVSTAPISNKMHKYIGHQGLLGAFAGNTAISYQLAKQAGLTYVECDVQKTYDGVYILAHDNTLISYTDYNGNISDSTYDEIIQHPITKGNNVSNVDTTVSFLTLDAFLNLCVTLELIPFVEIKTASDWTQTDIENIVDKLVYYGFETEGLITSFGAQYIEWAKEHNPKIKTEQAFSTYSQESIDSAASIGASVVGLPIAELTRDRLNYIHSKGMGVYPFNLSHSDFATVITMGVDGVYFNDVKDAFINRQGRYSGLVIDVIENHPVTSVVERKMIVENKPLPFNGSGWQKDADDNAVTGQYQSNRFSYLPMKCRYNDTFTLNIPDGYKGSMVVYDKNFTFDTKIDTGWMQAGAHNLIIPPISGSINDLRVTFTIAKTDDSDLSYFDIVNLGVVYSRNNANYLRYPSHNENRLLAGPFPIGPNVTIEAPTLSGFKFGYQVYNGYTLLQDSGWKANGEQYTTPANAMCVYVQVATTDGNTRIDVREYDNIVSAIQFIKQP